MYDYGGVKTSTLKDQTNKNSNHSNNNSLSQQQQQQQQIKDVHCIYPTDLLPFLRKPFFLIVDSLNSDAFRQINEHKQSNIFGQPFLCLMSPSKLPNVFKDYQMQHGSVFTQFLTNPLFAFCYICSISNLSHAKYEQLDEKIKHILEEIAKLFQLKSKQNEMNVVVYLQFGQDDFMRSFILRFVFCFYTLRLHRAFKVSPICYLL